MKSLIIIAALFISNLSFANDLKDMAQFHRSIEGTYEGVYGLLNDKACTVEVSSQNLFFDVSDFVYTLKREDGKSLAISVRSAEYRRVNDGGFDLMLPNSYKVKFDKEGTLKSISIRKDIGGFTLPLVNLRCGDLKKIRPSSLQ